MKVHTYFMLTFLDGGHAANASTRAFGSDQKSVLSKQYQDAGSIHEEENEQEKNSPVCSRNRFV